MLRRILRRIRGRRCILQQPGAGKRLWCQLFSEWNWRRSEKSSSRYVPPFCRSDCVDSEIASGYLNLCPIDNKNVFMINYINIIS